MGGQRGRAAFSLHPGEEPPLSGTGGAGNIFFSGCNLECVFCQNYPISQLGVGRLMKVEELAREMLSLERRGANNINLVTPTPWYPQIARALVLARGEGLNLPVVSNTNGYEKEETVSLLRDFVDVYLPDMKYADDRSAFRLSGAVDYVGHNRRAVRVMFRQAGHLRTDGDGLAMGGLIVRHLVLPEDLSGTEDVLDHLAAVYGPEICVSLMFQYFPAWRSVDDPRLGRKLNDGERERALDLLTRKGFRRGWYQGCAGASQSCSMSRSPSRA